MRAMARAERLLSLGQLFRSVSPRYARAQSLVRAALVAIASKDDSLEFKELASAADAYLDTFGGDTITTRGERIAYHDATHPDRAGELTYRGQPMVDARAVRGACWIEAMRVAWQIEVAIDACDISPDDAAELATSFLAELCVCPSLRSRLSEHDADIAFDFYPWFDPDRDWDSASDSEQALHRDAVCLANRVSDAFSAVRRKGGTVSAAELSEALVVAGLKACGYSNARDVFSGLRKHMARGGHEPDDKGAPVSPRVRRRLRTDS